MSKKISNFQKKQLITTLVFTLLIISIIAIATSIFVPDSDIGFSELSLLTYNESSQSFEAKGYPYQLDSGENITIFFMVKNFENVVKYYQIQIKVTKISQEITYKTSLNSSNSFSLYENNTFEKILSPATDKEKKDIGVFSGDYIWGPINVTLYSNSQVESVLEGEEQMKIVFELWEFKSIQSSFEYSGIFTFLELWYFY